jgi:nucleoside-diphosphate-sugar epimerase
LSAAERTDALLVTLENVYGYGPTGGKPMTEDHPLAATVKGRTRAAMTRELLAAAEADRVRIAIGRASDLFGAGARCPRRVWVSARALLRSRGAAGLPRLLTDVRGESAHGGVAQPE